MKFLYLVIIFELTYSLSFAQKNKSFKIDSFPDQSILLDKGWKWIKGDNSNYANLDFNDSNWVKIDPTKEIADLPQVVNAGIGWIRLSISVDSSLLNRPLALNVMQVGSSEIYLNGKLLSKSGKVSSLEKEKFENFYYLGVPTIFVFQKAGENVLSIRFSISKSRLLLPLKLNGKTKLFRAKLMDPNGLEEQKVEKYIQIVSYYGLLSGIFFILSILHFIFYWFYKEDKINLTFSIALSFGLLHFLLALWAVVTNSSSYSEYFEIVANISVSFFIVIIGFVLFQYFSIKNKAILWILSAIHIGSSFLAITKFSNSFSQIVYLVSTVILYLVCVFVIFKRKKEKHSQILLISYLLLIILLLLRTLVVYDLVNLEHKSLFANIFMALFYLSLPIGFSILLAKENALNRRALLSKLVEVEQLSNEKQQILSSQNETLEILVEEKTFELKASQAQLIQKEKLASLGELTAGIAHEIQNPLNFVNNFSEVSVELLDEMKEEIEKGNTLEVKEIAEDLKQNLEKIHHHGKRASGIVKAMLEHSRTATGQKEPTDINALADEFLRLSYHGLRAKDKTFTGDFKAELDPNLPLIEIVPQDLGRVFLNLINNAFYACNERAKLNSQNLNPEDYKPLVIVSTHKTKDNIEIKIKDNGSGISEENLEKIFQPFFTTKPTGKGTGLGLSLAYDIVTKGHGGNLEVVSKEGVGTEFIICLNL